MYRSRRGSHPGNLSVGQPQDALPVGTIDEELVRFSDGSDVGTHRDVGAMRDAHQVSAQLPLPLALGVGHIHTLSEVSVCAGPVKRQRSVSAKLQWVCAIKYIPKCPLTPPTAF